MARLRFQKSTMINLWQRRFVKILSGFVLITGVLGGLQIVAGAWTDLFTSGEPSLRITTLTNVAQFGTTAPYIPEFLFPKGIAAREAPPDATSGSSLVASPQEGRWEWAHTHGAVDANNTLVRIVFTRTGTTPVEITNLEVTDLSCGTPLSGTLVTYPWAFIAHKIMIAEGNEPTTGSNFFLTHLDGMPGRMGISIAHPTFGEPKLQYYGRNGKPAPTPFPISLNYGQEASFDVLGVVSGSDCRWRIRVLWTSGGKTMHADVPDQPLQTSRVGSSPTQYPGEIVYRQWNPDSKTWEAPTPQDWGEPVGE
jgi:hypothetical protein